MGRRNRSGISRCGSLNSSTSPAIRPSRCRADRHHRDFPAVCSWLVHAVKPINFCMSPLEWNKFSVWAAHEDSSRGIDGLVNVACMSRPERATSVFTTCLGDLSVFPTRHRMHCQYFNIALQHLHIDHLSIFHLDFQRSFQLCAA